ncbi:MAG: C40 family peptidase [Muribaculaceae bacterium]|nr:C40 family peptidase [Muribaculaceae bacterium]
MRKSVFTLFLVLGVFGVFAQSGKHSAHNRMHEQQLAKNVSPIEKNMILESFKEEVLQREESQSPVSEESDRMIDDLLTEAHKYIGTRYVHGAKGPHAFDCSGYTSYIYKQFGYTISPSSRHQYTEGTPVSRKELRKGDLVFFTSRSSGKNVGHVGIVVTANNETGEFTFIHASLKGVKVSECEGYYERRYVGAKRIITE